MENANTDRLVRLAENEIGDYLKRNREAKGYLLKEICDGICSVPTLSRIEAGGRIVDFLMIEAFLSRMKIARVGYEFVLDEEDYEAYKRREEIEILVKNGDCEGAERRMAAYERRYGAEELQGQFLSFHRALLERARPRPDWQKGKALFRKALMATAPDYQEKFRRKEILSNLELSCMTEIIYCTEDALEREKEYEELYAYYTWNCRREGFFPLSYRTAMQYYGECLYQNGKYEKCIRICDEGLKELFRTSKVENREALFLLRARARERRGLDTEKERKLCLKDFLTAFHLRAFYGGEGQAEGLRRYIGEEYGWEFVE